MYEICENGRKISGTKPTSTFIITFTGYYVKNGSEEKPMKAFDITLNESEQRLKTSGHGNIKSDYRVKPTGPITATSATAMKGANCI